MEGSPGPLITHPYGFPMTAWRYSALCGYVSNPISLRPIYSSASADNSLVTEFGIRPLGQIHAKPRLGELYIGERFPFVREADLTRNVDIVVHARGQSATRPVSHVTCPTVHVK